MIGYILKKFLRVIVILCGVTLITFLLIHAVPGNPWNNYLSAPQMLQNAGIDRSTINELNRRFGLDQPLWRQYTR